MLAYSGQDLRGELAPKQDAGHLLVQGAATDLISELMADNTARPSARNIDATTRNAGSRTACVQAPDIGPAQPLPFRPLVLCLPHGKAERFPMISKARSPNTLKGALVTIDPANPTPLVIAFYYNPSSLRRSLAPQRVGGEENDRSEAIRFTGAPVQTITVEIEIDVTGRALFQSLLPVEQGIRLLGLTLSGLGRDESGSDLEQPPFNFDADEDNSPLPRSTVSALASL